MLLTKKQNEPVVASSVSIKATFRRFLKAFLIAYAIFLAILLMSALLGPNRDTEFKNFLFFLPFFLLPMPILIGGFCYGIYRLLGFISKWIPYRHFNRIHLPISLIPVFALILLSGFATIVDCIRGEGFVLSLFSNNTVSLKDVDNFQTRSRWGLKCHYKTAYFQTTPEVVEHLLKQRKFQQKWPFPEEHLDYFSKEEILKQPQGLIRNRIGTLPENWPDPTTWDGVEVFEVTENDPHSRPGSYYRYCLITDAKRHNVIIEYDNICP